MLVVERESANGIGTDFIIKYPSGDVRQLDSRCSNLDIRCKDAEELSREAQQQANRHLRYRHADDGSLILNAQLPAEIGALLIKALTTAIPQPIPAPEVKSELPQDDLCDDETADDVPAETPPPQIPIAVRRADALARISHRDRERWALSSSSRAVLEGNP